MNGTDGQFAFVWQDDVMQVIFHTATLMPTLDTDPNCNNKKKNIGNDFVTIVYNESGCDYNIRTVKVNILLSFRPSPFSFSLKFLLQNVCTVISVHQY